MAHSSARKTGRRAYNKIGSEPRRRQLNVPQGCRVLSSDPSSSGDCRATSTVAALGKSPRCPVGVSQNKTQNECQFSPLSSSSSRSLRHRTRVVSRICTLYLSMHCCSFFVIFSMGSRVRARVPLASAILANLFSHHRIRRTTH